MCWQCEELAMNCVFGKETAQEQTAVMVVVAHVICRACRGQHEEN